MGYSALWSVCALVNLPAYLVGQVTPRLGLVSTPRHDLQSFNYQDLLGVPWPNSN
jgi:hypothetical protein